MTDIQKTRIIRILSVLLAAVILFCATLTPRSEAASTEEYYENAVLFWINVERARNGLSELRTFPAIQQVADLRADESERRFEHTRPNGTKWTTAVREAGITFSKVGEILAASHKNPYDTVTQWMNSKIHHDIILNGEYDYLGVGYNYSPNSDYTHYWAGNFVAGYNPPSSSKAFYVAPTGVNVSKSSMTLAVGGTDTVAGSPVPEYATEAVTCTSSNPAVLQVVGAQVNVFTVKGIADGNAELTVKCGSHSRTVSVKVGAGDSSQPFVDISSGSVYYNAVKWAYKNGITDGTDAKHFSPAAPCTRGQVVTFLWRAEGSPEPKSSCPFTDVSKQSPYYKAIAWAAEKGITTGFDATHFKPNDTVTRAQFVTFLWRYEKQPASTGNLAVFKDAGQIAQPYRQAVAWAVANDIAGGYEDGTFRPNEVCTRWAVALFMYRDMA